MGLILDLESFDAKTHLDTAAPVASYEDGVVAGRDQAEAQFAQDQARLKESLVQALNDSVFGYQEAQAHFLSGMRAYVDALLCTILPVTLAPVLHAELQAILTEGFEKDAKEPVKLHVSPDQIEPVRALVVQLGFSHIDVCEDASLSAHAVFMAAENRALSIDVDAALAAIKEQSAVLLHPIEKVS